MKPALLTNSDILDLLCDVLPFIEDAGDDEAYKPGVTKTLVARLRAAIKQLEAK